MSQQPSPGPPLNKKQIQSAQLRKCVFPLKRLARCGAHLWSSTQEVKAGDLKVEVTLDYITIPVRNKKTLIETESRTGLTEAGKGDSCHCDVKSS